MSRLPVSSTRPRAIGLVVFLAGFTFLVYEVSWNRLLSLVLGTTVTAATIVLAGFMAGFGYGALFWGRRASGRTDLGRLMGLLVFGMGFSSALDYFLFRSVVPDLYARFAATGTAAGFPDALMFLLVGLLLFLPAFLMGGIFPLASRIAAGPDGKVAATVGGLYAAETLGSTLGGLASGFILLGTLGQAATVFLAVIVNLVLGFWVFVDRRFEVTGSREEVRDPSPEAAAVSGNDPEPASSRRSRRKGRKRGTDGRDTLLRAAVLGAFVCGFSILTLQVLWMRIFKVYLANTSYTFALVSSLAILGIFSGSMLFHRRGGAALLSPVSLIRVLMGMVVAVGLGLVLLVNLPQLLMFPLQGLFGQPLARVLGLPLLAALLIVFPPAVFSGYAFPLACSMFTTSKSGVSGDVGFIMMINTIGSVFGPVIAAFLIIPTLGAVMGVIVVMAWLAAGALLIGSRGSGTTMQRAVLGSVLAVVLVLVVVRPEIRILPPSFVKFDREILFYQEGVEGTLAVGKDRDTRTQAKYTFVNNSAVIGSSYDAIKVVKMVGHFPFLAGAEVRDVLVIGFGIGVTTSAIASHQEVESIDCVELVDGLQDAAVFYSERNHDVVSDSRLHFHSGDGRHFLQKTGRRFDLISCDPTHPILGSGNLYTRDYFELCREHLKPGGMVSQYLPLHKLGRRELLGIIGTFSQVFPECTVWLGHYHAVLLGSDGPLDLDFRAWSERVDRLGEDNDFYIEPHHLAATLVLDGPAVARLCADSPVNTDDLSYTEFFTAGCLDPANTANNLQFLQENRVDAARVFTDIPDPGVMDRFIQGNALLNESLYYGLTGDRGRSRRALEEACRVNPEDKEFPFLMRLNF